MFEETPLVRNWALRTSFLNFEYVRSKYSGMLSDVFIIETALSLLTSDLSSTLPQVEHTHNDYYAQLYRSFTLMTILDKAAGIAPENIH